MVEREQLARLRRRNSMLRLRMPESESSETQGARDMQPIPTVVVENVRRDDKYIMQTNSNCACYKRIESHHSMTSFVFMGGNRG